MLCAASYFVIYIQLCMLVTMLRIHCTFLWFCVLWRKKAFTHHSHLSRVRRNKTVSYKPSTTVEQATWSMENCTKWNDG